MVVRCVAALNWMGWGARLVVVRCVAALNWMGWGALLLNVGGEVCCCTELDALGRTAGGGGLGCVLVVDGVVCL